MCLYFVIHAELQTLKVAWASLSPCLLDQLSPWEVQMMWSRKHWEGTQAPYPSTTLTHLLNDAWNLFVREHCLSFHTGKWALSCKSSREHCPKASQVLEGISGHLGAPLWAVLPRKCTPHLCALVSVAGKGLVSRLHRKAVMGGKCLKFYDKIFCKCWTLLHH